MTINPGKLNWVTQEEYENDEEAVKNRAKKEQIIVIPDSAEGEEILKKITTNMRCGNCRHFSLRRGQEEIRKTRFIEQLVREMDLSTLGQAHRWDGVGMCEHWTGGPEEVFITHVFAPARASRRFVEGSSVSYEDGDLTVECPAYEPRRGKTIRSSRMVAGSRTVGTD